MSPPPLIKKECIFKLAAYSAREGFLWDQQILNIMTPQLSNSISKVTVAAFEYSLLVWKE